MQKVLLVIASVIVALQASADELTTSASFTEPESYFGLSSGEELADCSPTALLNNSDVKVIYANCRGVFLFEERPPGELNAGPFCFGKYVRLFPTSIGILMLRYYRDVIGTTQQVEYAIYSVPKRNERAEYISHGVIPDVCNPQFATFYDDVLRFQNLDFNVQTNNFTRKVEAVIQPSCSATPAKSVAIDVTSANVWSEVERGNLMYAHAFGPYITYEQRFAEVTLTILSRSDDFNSTCAFSTTEIEAVIVVSNDDSVYVNYNRSSTSTTTTEAPFVCPVFYDRTTAFHAATAAIISLLLSIIAEVAILQIVRRGAKKRTVEVVTVPDDKLQ